MSVEVVLPKVDMDMESGVIAAWKVSEGDRVQAGDVLFEMETSKSIMEVEAPASGVVRGLARVDGAALAVGTAVAWIDDGAGPPGARTSSAAANSSSGAAPPPRPPYPTPASAARPHAAPPSARGASAAGDMPDATPGIRATPLARRTARAAGVDLARVPGSGPRGRIVAADVSSAASAANDPTLTVALAFIAARTLMAHPLVNASVEGDAARMHPHADIGIAMERDGDLVVPVLRSADTKSLADLVAEFARLRDAVRAHTVTPGALSGGTFTLSNLGMHGVDAFTAIINPPQSAILAIGRVVDTPVGRDGIVVLRPMATLSLSSDHRIVDGVTAARFMADLRRSIEHPALE